jgi:hypothetical protein
MSKEWRPRVPTITCGALLLVPLVFFAIFYSLMALRVQPLVSVSNAEATINSLEVALTAILADSGYRDLRSLIDDQAFQRALQQEMERSGADEFTATVAIHSALASALMEHGKEADKVLASAAETSHLASVLRSDALSQLGKHYMMPNFVVDPWGTPYRFFFGPWDNEMGIMPLRVYQSANMPKDELTVSIDPSNPVPQLRGFPPESSKPFYIWSLGKNRKSDQAVFDPTGEYKSPASKHYRSDAPSSYWGGGDDITSWDPARSHDVFYRR